MTTIFRKQGELLVRHHRNDTTGAWQHAVLLADSTFRPYESMDVRRGDEAVILT